MSSSVPACPSGPYEKRSKPAGFFEPGHRKTYSFPQGSLGSSERFWRYGPFQLLGSGGAEGLMSRAARPWPVFGYLPLSTSYAPRAVLIDLMSPLAAEMRASSERPTSRGTTIAARMPMMTTTSNSSIRV